MSKAPLHSSNTGFFSLPRELRDEIYAHLFTLSPCLDASFHGVTLNLHYSPRCCAKQTIFKPDQSWLLASKTVMTEALQEYAREADWVWHGPYAILKRCSLPIPMNMLEIRRMSLYVGNLVYWETGFRIRCGHGRSHDGREMIRTITGAMRNNNVRVNTIRLQGYSYMLAPHEQIHSIFANLRQAFEGIQVMHWELEIIGERMTRSIQVLDVGPEGDLRVLVDEREPGMGRVHSKMCSKWTISWQDMERALREAERRKALSERREMFIRQARESRACEGSLDAKNAVQRRSRRRLG